MKKKSTVIFLIAFCFCAYPVLAQQTVNVGITITKKLKKDNLKTELESAEVTADVIQNGNVVIAAGTPVVLDIQAEKHRGLGVPGTITVKTVSTTDVNGQIVMLNSAEKSDVGKNRRGAAIGCGVVFGIITCPVGLLFLCIKGGKAVIPIGTQMVATAVLNQ